MPFWDNLYKDILGALKNAAVLESGNEHDELCRPSDLSYVPPGFRYNGGALFNLPSIKSWHLGFRYDAVFDYLEQVGVKTLSISDLFEEFQLWINERGVGGIKAQPPAWHRKISSLFCSRRELKQKLKELPIIPLRNRS
jgi:hypothetical protein